MYNWITRHKSRNLRFSTAKNRTYPWMCHKPNNSFYIYYFSKTRLSETAWTERTYTKIPLYLVKIYWVNYWKLLLDKFSNFLLVRQRTTRHLGVNIRRDCTSHIHITIFSESLEFSKIFASQRLNLVAYSYNNFLRISWIRYNNCKSKTSILCFVMSLRS